MLDKACPAATPDTYFTDSARKLGTDAGHLAQLDAAVDGGIGIAWEGGDGARRIAAVTRAKHVLLPQIARRSVIASKTAAMSRIVAILRARRFTAPVAGPTGIRCGPMGTATGATWAMRS